MTSCFTSLAHACAFAAATVKEIINNCLAYMSDCHGDAMPSSIPRCGGALARLAECPPLRSSVRHKLDTVWSMDHYNVEYGGFLSNHLAHGVIAFERLGAGDDRIEQFANEYKEKLEPPSDLPAYQHDHHTPVERFDPNLLGARKNWYGLLNFYKRETASYGWQGAVRRYFPKLCDGVAGSAVHGLIQLGYGCHANSAQLVAEGLAYLHMSHLTFRYTSGGAREADVDDVLDEIRGDMRYAKLLEEHTEEMKAKMGKTSTFQARMAVLSTYAQLELGELADRVRLHGNDPALYVIDAAISVYARSAVRNDFFLLHGVTGAWALKETVAHVAEEDRPRAVRDFVAMWLAVYIARGRPALNAAPLYMPTEGEWDGVCQRALAIHHGDEHVQKMVQVCAERAASDKERKNWPVYFAAAQQTVDHSFSY